MGFPDIVAFKDGEKYGFEVKLVDPRYPGFRRIHESIFRAYYMLNEEGFHEFAFVLVAPELEQLERATNMIRRRFVDVEANVKVLLCVAGFDEERGDVYGFKVVDEVSLSRDQ